MPTDMTFNFDICVVQPVVQQAAHDLASFIHQCSVDPNNLVFLMGQYHRDGPMEMAQVHFTNALHDVMPFTHFCNELPDSVFAPHTDAYRDVPDMSLYEAAETYAQPLGTEIKMLGDMPIPMSSYLVPAFSIVNTLRGGRQNHFIDLETYKEDPLLIAQPPSLSYYHRYKDRKGVLADTFHNNKNLFHVDGAHVISTFGLMQRDVNMMGRIDDILQKKQGPVVASVGLNHVHDCYKGMRPTLTDYLLGAGKDVVTLSFVSGYYESKGGYKTFCERLDEQRDEYLPGKTHGSYHAHAHMRLA